MPDLSPARSAPGPGRLRNQPLLSTAASAGYAQSEAATSILVSTVLSIVTFSFAIYLIDGGLAAA